MKTLLKFLFGLASLSLLFVSCDGDDFLNPVQSLPVVQFGVKEASIKENDGEYEATLTFDKSFPNDATIKILIDSAMVKYFTSNPSSVNNTISLIVKQNEQKATIKLKPVDNGTYNESRVVTFNISSFNTEYVLGEKNSFRLIIEDNDTPTQAQESYVNFIPSNFTLKENEQSWQEYSIYISENATANGTLTIEAKSEKATYGTHFITEPAFNNNLLSLTAVAGTPVLKFKIKPLNDNHITGNSTISFAIKETSGNLKKGTALKDSLNITDDELTGLPKGYEVSGGNWGLRQTYEYNTKGNIAQVLIESYFPFYKRSVNTYYYNDLDQVTRINTAPDHDLIYSWSEGKIIRESKVDNGVIDQYIEYDYDYSGNVSGFQSYYLQENGTFALGITTVLLYFPDNNLYKKLVYTHAAGTPEDGVLNATSTFKRIT